MRGGRRWGVALTVGVSVLVSLCVRGCVRVGVWYCVRVWECVCVSVCGHIGSLFYLGVACQYMFECDGAVFLAQGVAPGKSRLPSPARYPTPHPILLVDIVLLG